MGTLCPHLPSVYAIPISSFTHLSGAVEDVSDAQAHHMLHVHLCVDSSSGRRSSSISRMIRMSEMGRMINAIYLYLIA